MKGELLLLDGATGTELNRRGVDTGLSLWSANALTSDTGLRTLREIHLDYLKAGADVLTTNTFRTHRQVLAGKGYDARELTRRAVATALEAVAEFGQPARVAASVAPLEDCYRPDLVPPNDDCRAEHSERIHHLVEAGVDLVLIETMTSIRKAAAAAQLATITGPPTWVSIVCDRESRILSGESLAVAARGECPGRQLRPSPHADQTTRRVADDLWPRFSPRVPWQHWLRRREGRMDQHGRRRSGVLPSVRPNVVGADCGRLLRHHAGAHSQTKCSAKPRRSEGRFPTTQEV